MVKNIFKSLFKVLFTLYIVLYITANNIFAYTLPTFPSCLNTQGTLKVRHTDGPHGIPGDTSTYFGIDSVYTLTDNTLMQCLCPTNGNGIQTNWWKFNGLSEIEALAPGKRGRIKMIKIEIMLYLLSIIIYMIRERSSCTSASFRAGSDL